MSARVAWLKPISKFVLEVGPPLSAVVIGGYVLTGMLNRPATPAVEVAPTPAASVSGEELTAMIQATHAAALVSAKLTAPSEASTALASAKPEPRKHTAKLAVPMPPARTARSAKPSALPVETIAASQAAPPAALPPPVAIVPEAARESRSWYGRAWGAVAGWSGAVAHTTRLDAAAGLAVAAPVAAARAGRRSLEAVAELADAVIPDPRR